MITVKFQVHVNNGHLYAEGKGVGIYISDRSWNALVEDIIETVEVYYNLPPETKFNLIMETRLTCTGRTIS